MRPLGIVLSLAMSAAPQQNAPAPQGGFVGKIPQQSQLHRDRMNTRRLTADQLRQQNTCYFIRSYHFRRFDDMAPVPAGVTTCTPANVLQQRRVFSKPGSMYVPLVMHLDGEEDSGK